MSEIGNVKDDLIVEVKKKRPKFKAGSELAGSVNRMAVDWVKEEDEESETLTISLHLTSEPG